MQGSQEEVATHEDKDSRETWMIDVIDTDDSAEKAPGADELLREMLSFLKLGTGAVMLSLISGCFLRGSLGGKFKYPYSSATE